jgi:hypothetical protein
MKRRTGMKSRREPAKAASRSLARERFHALPLFRDITAFEKPGNSELP